ncbi:unnamed protein product [Toxocara canis]|uniref:Uncharacterized protein n=1 Tax=Toxocara canis TaxID=6265 RepID=A0A183U9K4_TOXCA|nr:unnamed protein product [Toxocara canis]
MGPTIPRFRNSPRFLFSSSSLKKFTLAAEPDPSHLLLSGPSRTLTTIRDAHTPSAAVTLVRNVECSLGLAKGADDHKI